MSEEHAVESQQDQQSDSQPQPARPAPRRTPFLAYALSALALALAAIALVGMLKLNQRLNAQQPPRELEHKLAAVEHRVSHVEELLSTSRKDMVRAELKKMLLNLRELSRLADESTRAEIAKAEAVLMRLSSPATRVRAKVDMESTKQARSGTAATPPAGDRTHQAAAPQPSHPTSKPQHPHARKSSSTSGSSDVQSSRSQAPKQNPSAGAADSKTAPKAAKPSAGSTGKSEQAPPSKPGKPTPGATGSKP